MRILTFIFICATLLFSTQDAFSQSHKKGSFYIYWGWNRASYTKSDITFSGNNYDFTLSDVIAKDRQTKFNFKTYFNPTTITIPQYNFRIGYHINDKYNISIGIDHMKYVMQNNQIVNIVGHIDSTGTIYDGVYQNDDQINLSPDFLLFEHTDGLNYINTEFRRMDDLISRKNWSLSITEGVGVGALYPRTNTTILHHPRYDEFHLSGFGADAVLGLNFTFCKYFFIQPEAKLGYINMPDIRTTMDVSDKAKQDFFFAQANVVFGVCINTRKNDSIGK